MRAPSTFMQSHGWWLDAIAGRDPARHDGLPECGYFRMQHVKKGPYVPVRVTLSRDIDHDTGELAAPELVAQASRLALAELAADGAWSHPGGLLEVALASASFANRDARGTASGRYRAGRDTPQQNSVNKTWLTLTYRY